MACILQIEISNKLVKEVLASDYFPIVIGESQLLLQTQLTQHLGDGIKEGSEVGISVFTSDGMLFVGVDA